MKTSRNLLLGPSLVRMFIALLALGCSAVRKAPTAPTQAAARILRTEKATANAVGICAEPTALEALLSSQYRDEASSGFDTLGAWTIPLRERLFSGFTALGRRWHQDVEASCEHQSASSNALVSARLLCLETVHAEASVTLELVRAPTPSRAQRFDAALDKLRLDISDCESDLVVEFFDIREDDAISRTARALLAKSEIGSMIGEATAPNGANEALSVAKQGSSRRLVVDSLLAVARHEKSALRHDVARLFLEEASGIAQQASYSLGAARAIELKYPSGEQLLDVLRMKTEILGDSHPELAVTFKHLSGHFRSVGNYDRERSVNYAKEALAIHRKTGATTLVIDSLFDLSSKMFDVRTPKDLPVYEEALTLSRAYYGEESPQVALALKRVASYLVLPLGRRVQAIEALQAALEIQQRVFGVSSLEVASTLDELGQALDDVRRTSDALAMMTRAHEIRVARLSRQDPSLARSYSYLGGMFMLRERGKQALPLLEEALRLNLDAHGAPSDEVASSYIALSEWADRYSTPEETQRYYQKAVEAGYELPECSQ